MSYLLIKGWAGLGNRMLGVASGLLYAEITGRRPIVDWGDSFYYSDDGSDTFHRFFDAPSVGRLDEIPEGASVSPEVWQGRLRDPALDILKPLLPAAFRTLQRHASADLLRTDQPADVLVMWSTRESIDPLRPHLRGEHAHLARRHTDAILRWLFETRMPPRREIAERVARFQREQLSGPSVGVHVRYSDRRARLDAIKRRLERLLAREPGLTVFLATDNAAVRDEFERSHDAVSTPHWYPEPGEVSHRGPDRPNPFERGVEALVDLLLLARCDHLIGDRVSSFSRVAMMLSGAPRSHISDVQALPGRWHLPVKAAWRHTVPGPAAPLAVAVARRLAR